MKKSIISILFACCVFSTQAEIMWHVAGTNLYARKQCLERVQMIADSLTGVDYYFANIPKQVDATNLDSVYEMVFDRLVQTGAVMPYGQGDIRMSDEGSTSFYRTLWNLNELPADGGFWIWNDVGVSDIQNCAWTSANEVVGGAYLRLLYNMVLQNSYLQAAEKLNLYPEEQAQVRFVRALTAWYMLDLFPASHFTTQPIIDANATMTRQELYTWLEAELKALISLLPQARTDLYRVDADAAKMLLARLYLNAEVYTGTVQWNLASQYAEQVMNGLHGLHTTGTSAYSPYQELFMGDNDINGAAGEALLLLKQDGQTAYGYGGSMFTIAITRNGNSMPSSCLAGKWQCWRAGYRLIEAFATSQQLSLKGTEYTMPAQLGDDRAMFYADNNYPTPSLYNSYGSFEKTWSVNKFTNRYSTDPMDGSACSAVSSEWPDTDLPLMRSAEAWLTFAEAQFRLGNSQVARNTIASLRNRAHAETPATITLDYILDEWLREFYSEGRRRVDLVRFGQFASPNATRTWEGHSAVTNTAYNTYPTPDLVAAYPRFDNKVRYYAVLVPRYPEWNPETGYQCDSCTEGEMYIDMQSGISYSINFNDYGIGNPGAFNTTYPINTTDTLNLELVEFPYMQYPAFTTPLPQVTPTDNAFTIMLHSDTDYGNNLVVLGDYLTAAGEWIYSEANTKPTSHATTGTNVNNQSFVRFEAVGNGWHQAVVYPIVEKDNNDRCTVPGYAKITGIANYPTGSTSSPQKISPIQKVNGIVQWFTEKSNGSTEFMFSQLSYYEDPEYGRIYYSSKNTDRVVFLAIPAVQ